MTEEVAIKIKGDAASAQAAFEKTAVAGSTAMKQIMTAQQAVMERSSALTGVIVGMGATLAGTAFVRGVQQQLDVADAMDEAAQKAGIATSKFSELAYAGRFAGLSSEDLVKVLSKVNEATMKAAGGDKAMKGLLVDTLQVSVRDASGQLRDADKVLMDLIGTISKIENPVLRASTSADVFGQKLGPQLLPLINLTREGVEDLRREANELGVVISDKTGAAAGDLKDTLDRLSAAQDGVYNSIMTKMLPGLAQSASLFLENYRNAGLLSAVLLTLAQRAKEAMGYSSLDEQGRTAHASAARVAVLGREIERLNELAKENPKSMVEQGYGAPAVLATERIKKLRAEMDQLIRESMAASNKLKEMATNEAAGGTAATPAGKKPGGGGAEAAATAQAGVQAALEAKIAAEAAEAKRKADADVASARRRANAEATREANEARRQQRDAYDDRIGQLRTELAQWRNNTDEQRRVATQIANEAKAMFGAKSKEYAQAAQELVRIDQRAADQRRQIEADLRESELQSSLASVELARAEADQQLTLGYITQAQHLALQEQHELEMTAIKRQALLERLNVLANDPDMSPVERERIYRQIEDLERQHMERMNEIKLGKDAQTAAPGTSVMGSLEESIKSGTTALIMQQQTAMETLRGIWRSTASSFVTEMITKPLAAWVAGQARMTLATILGVNTRTAAEATGAAMSTSITAGSVLKTIGMKSFEAAASVYASIAAIPVVGPFMAPLMAAGAIAAVGSFASKIFSAEGGFDIPAGVNPMVQAHSREMILPAKHADVIRGLADGRLGGGGGDTIQLSVSAMDARSFETWLRGRGGDALVREISMRKRSLRGG